ncbi:ABC transporter ATP-binding protein [uncultured Jatrophihabitans sp.]|uniref:ABC transporter ATP-binding protein n=1 Tax=uncultured Jatrophihabitans sp. TaxID=1610747 RepID=UPI0035CBC1E3
MRFGGIVALSDVSIEVEAGAMVGLVGPNGAGKSTLFAVLSGLLRPKAGRTSLGGDDVTRLSAQRRAQRGLARTFQQPELFLGLTVREHLVLAYRSRHARSRLWSDMFTVGSLRRPDKAEAERVEGLIELLSLGPVADTVVDVLSLGTSRLVEVGRALATSPSVMLLDEPLSGLDAHEAASLAHALRRTVEQEHISALLVEHDVPTVLEHCSKVYVLDFGRMIASGDPGSIRSNPDVRAAYLGDEDVAM